MAKDAFTRLERLSCEIKNSNDDKNEERICMMNFTVEDGSTAEEIKLLISRASLDVLLEGLHKIQNQLTNVAAKTKT